MKSLPIMALLTSIAFPAITHAAGDVVAGEEQFNRQCVSCHVMRNEAGDVLAGRGAKAGPNLYGMVGRTVASVEDFRYGDSIVKAGEAGAIWDEGHFVAYVQNPTEWLRDTLSDPRARSKMAYQVRDAGQAADIYAFIASVQ